MPAPIKKETMDFLKQLKKNNNRDWFNANKDKYQAAMDNYAEFIGELIKQTGSFDKSVANLKPKDCVFRIYRDTRFSKDKTPYKTHFGAHLIGSGKECGRAGYYIHLEPGATFVGGGLHMPESDRLKAVRQDISYNADAFKKIINAKAFKDTFKEVKGDKLKTVPKGFDKDDAMLPYLQLKDFVATTSVDDKQVLATNFAAYCNNVYKNLFPLNEFLNASL